MTTLYTCTLSLSLGGDVPTWEGEATVSYTVLWGAPERNPTYDCGGTPADPDEVNDIKVIDIDGRAPEPHEADTIVAIIDGSSRVTDLLLEHAAECDAERHAEGLDRKAERDAERVRG